MSDIRATFIVAEMSANHNQSLDRAEQIIRAAVDSGADAIKLQTYEPGKSTIDCDNHFFRIKGTAWDGENLFKLYSKAYTPWEWHERLFNVARDCRIECFSTAFDPTSVDFLEDLGNKLYKIASFEIVDIPLLKKVAATGKPVIMSTGMASLSEIDEAVRTLRENGSGEITLLKCTSSYPAPAEEANLRTIPHLAQAFSCKAGLSDHTMGSAVAVAAVALGACVVEKHFTISRADGGPDGAFSMEPLEFKQLVQDIRTTEKALGRVSYELTNKEKGSVCFRRSLFAVKDISAGEFFTPDNVRSIRPGYGLHTRYLDIVLGSSAQCDLQKGTPLSWQHVVKDHI